MKATLSKLGLNQTEITLYLALLPIGSAPASVLSYRTGIYVNTARHACRQLAKKGLCSMIQKNNTLIFTAEPPEKISFLAEDEKRQAEEKIEQIHRIIGPLKAMYNPDTQLPRVRFYEGVEGVKHVYEDTIREGKTIYAFENTFSVREDSRELDAFFFSWYLPERKKKNIYAYVIMPGKKANQSCLGKSKKYFRETRLVPEKEFPLEMEINIYGDKVALFTVKKDETFAVILDSPAVSGSMKAVFDLCWNTAG